MVPKICGFVVTFLLFSTVFGQLSNNLDFDDLSKNLQDNPNLDDLQKKLAESGVTLPANFNQTKIDPEKIENALRKKCEQQNATDAIDALKSQQDTLKACVTQHLNGSAIQEELQVASETGSMDEVFAKYCNKWPAVYGCFDDVSVTARRCMSENEQQKFNRTLGIVHELQKFMCEKDGDRLAMFVAEGGRECIEEQQEGVKQCFNATIGDQLPQEGDDLSLVFSSVLAGDHCEDFDKVRLCVNHALEKCKDTTPANIVDASFKFVRKQLPCVSDIVALKADAKPSVLQGSSAAPSWTSSMYVTLGLIVVVLNKYY